MTPEERRAKDRARWRARWAAMSETEREAERARWREGYATPGRRERKREHDRKARVARAECRQAAREFKDAVLRAFAEGRLVLASPPPESVDERAGKGGAL